MSPSRRPPKSRSSLYLNHQTKKELSEKILINGAWLSKTLDRSVDYFVALQNCPKTKIDQVNLLKQRGSTIQVITEETIKGWFK